MKSAYRQILVHFDNTSRSAVRLALARRIAQAQEAAVAALHAVQPLVLALPYGADSGASAASILRGEDDARRAAAKSAFEQELAESGPTATWGQCADAAPGPFAQQALFADLVVLGQANREDPRSIVDVPVDFIEQVVAGSGKPALVVPHSGPAPKSIGTVAIAWKDTPESARAVAAAMPLMQRAAKVIVMTWGETGEPPAVDGGRLALDGYLRLHGIDAQFDRQATAASDVVGDLILSRCSDHCADLLVMGCYGHSRAREWVLGGASRTVLRSMTLPVLLAH